MKNAMENSSVVAAIEIGLRMPSRPGSVTEAYWISSESSRTSAARSVQSVASRRLTKPHAPISAATCSSRA